MDAKEDDRPHAVPVFVAIFGIFNNKFMTRAEPNVLLKDAAAELFGEEVLYVASGTADNVKSREHGLHGLLAMWRFQESGDMVFVLADACVMNLDFPVPGDMTVCTKITAAHRNQTAVLHIVCKATGRVVVTFPAIRHHGMSVVSNILCVYNPMCAPAAAWLEAGGRVHATGTPQILLQVFPSSKDAYTACCKMQRKILVLKTNRASFADTTGGGESAAAYVHQRPILLTFDTARRVCNDVSVILNPLDEFLKTMHVPTPQDVHAFSSMWSGL